LGIHLIFENVEMILEQLKQGETLAPDCMGLTRIRPNNCAFKDAFFGAIAVLARIRLQLAIYFCLHRGKLPKNTASWQESKSRRLRLPNTHSPPNGGASEISPTVLHLGQTLVEVAEIVRTTDNYRVAGNTASARRLFLLEHKTFFWNFATQFP
jgi:hypothetical protein